jgi:hypothetical protein
MGACFVCVYFMAGSIQSPLYLSAHLLCRNLMRYVLLSAAPLFTDKETEAQKAEQLTDDHMATRQSGASPRAPPFHRVESMLMSKHSQGSALPLCPCCQWPRFSREARL